MMFTDQITARPASKVAYCLRCGRASSFQQSTLDPRHPIVLCTRVGSDGEEHGHGRVVGTYDPDEADAIAELRKADSSTKRHPEHIAKGRVDAHCRTCATDPPPTAERAHRYSAIEDRYRLASHLEFSHGDRSSRTNLNPRDLRELIPHHRELHDRILERRGPREGEAIVIGGEKYRVRDVTEGAYALAKAGPSWQRSAIVLTIPKLTALEYDDRAAVWRIGSAEPKP